MKANLVTPAPCSPAAAEMCSSPDWEVLTELQQRAPAAMRHKIQLLMRYANDIDEAIVPDPYYGLNEGFTRVYEYCSDACEGIIENFEKKAKQLLAARAASSAANAQAS